jgi:hypothetical protein
MSIGSLHSKHPALQPKTEDVGQGLVGWANLSPPDFSLSHPGPIKRKPAKLFAWPAEEERKGVPLF